MRRQLNFYFWASLAFLFIFCATVLAQQPPEPPKIANPQPSSIQSYALFEFFGRKTPYEFWLTALILISGLAFFVVSTRFIHSVDAKKTDQAVRLVTTILVVVSTLVLITAGYNNEQIAPAFGLFGTLIGYLLGRSSRGSNQGPTGQSGQPENSTAARSGGTSP